MKKLSFKEKVLGAVAKIPKGSVTTYKNIAKAIGNPKSYRAVGTVLSKNYNPKIPCHRVIRSDGSLGRYNHGRVRKQAILKKEGALSGESFDGI